MTNEAIMHELARQTLILERIAKTMEAFTASAHSAAVAATAFGGAWPREGDTVEIVSNTGEESYFQVGARGRITEVSDENDEIRYEIDFASEPNPVGAYLVGDGMDGKWWAGDGQFKIIRGA